MVASTIQNIEIFKHFDDKKSKERSVHHRIINWYHVQYIILIQLLFSSMTNQIL